jgi:hypothetical protein
MESQFLRDTFSFPVSHLVSPNFPFPIRLGTAAFNTRPQLLANYRYFLFSHIHVSYPVYLTAFWHIDTRNLLTLFTFACLLFQFLTLASPAGSLDQRIIFLVREFALRALIFPKPRIRVKLLSSHLPPSLKHPNPRRSSFHHSQRLFPLNGT